MPLSDIRVKSLKAGIKPDGSTTSKAYRVTDEKGLYIEVPPPRVHLSLSKNLLKYLS